ncbi:acetoacetate--CoA ligase [uncultured Ilumatobacter sp.]|uniref:acetoacetate--CoA ligase n=1 Tax=uncultured Ilumatobacter sp. TaxID=879968 RepID=UPI00374F9689
MSEQRGAVTWVPADDAWDSSVMAEFAEHVEADDGLRLRSYDDVLDWSLRQPGEFWNELAQWQCINWIDKPTASLESASMPGATWFPGGTLNYAERALAHGAALGDQIAIIGRSQSRERDEVTWTELIDRVGRCRVGLRRLGIRRGDRVVAFAPNISETLVAFLATASLGATWSSCAPEFGVRAVTDRWAQIEPTVLIAVDGYMYGDRAIDRSDHVEEIVAALPTLEHVVRIPYLDASGTDGWTPLLAEHAPLEFEPVPFDHALYVLFSSGTTGLPKPIVHGHGGITLEHVKAWSLHYDLRPGDRVMWFTTTGWMMWNFLVSGLLTGSTIVLFDGDPAAPDLLELWRVAADEKVDVCGVSAPFVMACRKERICPGDELDLSRVRHLGSTGAPLPVEGFEWVPEAVGAHIQVGSMSGGTDVCTAFVGTAPMLPIRAGEIGARMLGCDVQAFRPDGSPCAPGETGELVIAAPMPSMPVGLWGDVSGERYRGTYFETFPGVWHHGDWITFFDDGACEITGRSDATLNRGGVRLGTSDFYVVVDSMPEIVDSVVVHLEDTSGEAGPGELILLVACAEGVALDAELVGRIKVALRTELSPRHVPDVIDGVPMIPRTLSGKKLEVPIKRMLLGLSAEQAASKDSLANPVALDHVAAWIQARRTGGGR